MVIMDWFGTNDVHVLHLIPPSSLYVYSLFAAELLLIYGWALVAIDIRKAATRTKEIETTVDTATGELYLLRWERLWGGCEIAIFGFSRHALVPPQPQDEGLSASKQEITN